MSTIYDTVSTTLSESGYSSYLSQAQPVIARLVDRERAISEHLIGLADEMDMDTEQVIRVLRDCGMAVPEPQQQPAAAASTDEPISGEDLAELRTQVRRLTEFARNYGFRD